MSIILQTPNTRTGSPGWRQDSIQENIYINFFMLTRIIFVLRKQYKNNEHQLWPYKITSDNSRTGMSSLRILKVTLQIICLRGCINRKTCELQGAKGCNTSKRHIKSRKNYLALLAAYSLSTAFVMFFNK